MDPALWELLLDPAVRGRTETGDGIVRFSEPEVIVDGLRIVSRFGSIVTCRLRREDLIRIRKAPGVASLKASRPIEGPTDHRQHDRCESDLPVGFGCGADGEEGPFGRGVVVGIIDWGCDFAHAAFRRSDGATRFLAVWDQRGGRTDRSPDPYGYGRLLTRSEIDAALQTDTPYAALGYHPGDADAAGGGSHGTHVGAIAAGSAYEGGAAGVAQATDLVFVHLADRGTAGVASLGDSVRILEAVDLVARQAGDRPWVINLSVGRHGGPHDGCSLVEMAFDEFLSEAPGRFIVQSAGNYFESNTHASGLLWEGEVRTLRMVIDRADVTPNELEIWYPGSDAFSLQVSGPSGVSTDWVRLGESVELRRGGEVVGRLYHRERDPNNGDNHIDLFLYTNAEPGLWSVDLRGDRVSNGRYHAWIERDSACDRCQSRFVPADADPRHTLGTLATGRMPLVVAAHDARRPDRPVSDASSSGPTRDGRRKPDLSAPGVAVVAARSAPRQSPRSPNLLTTKSGTSMAAPHVTGAVALCIEAAGRPLWAHEIRSLILDTVDPSGRMEDADRGGAGYLNIRRAVNAAARLRASREPQHLTDGPRPGRSNGRRTSMPPLDAGLVHDAASALDADETYRTVAYRGDDVWPYTVIGRPGSEPDESITAGDVLLCVALGRPGLGQRHVVADGRLERSRPIMEGRPIGFYGLVRSPGSPPKQHLMLDIWGNVPQGLMILRPPTAPTVRVAPGERLSPTGDSGEADIGGKWTGSGELLAFREQVLEAHIARSRRRSGPAKPDPTDAQRSTVPGTNIQMARVAAESAGAMLAAANEAIAQARLAGDPALGGLLRVSATSGYRGRDHQERLWRQYFPGYYEQTAAGRAGLSAGPHSDQAVEYMLEVFGIPRRIAAPGYSNHQSGIAIDLLQVVGGGERVRNSTRPAAVRRWRASWFHQWLTANAAQFGFFPYEREPWHWEFRGTGALNDDAGADRGVESEMWVVVPHHEGSNLVEFAEREHQSVGESVFGKSRSSIQYSDGGRALSLAEVVALAGDYFASYEEMNELSQSPAGRPQLAWARWHALELRGIEAEPHDLKGDSKELGDTVLARYYTLASRNESHFSAGGTARATYARWHAAALVTALDAASENDRVAWRRALTKEAFGAHFLSDMFAAGHVRTPVSHIRSWYSTNMPGSEALLRYMAQFMYEDLATRRKLPLSARLLDGLAGVVRTAMFERIRTVGGEAVDTFSLGDIVTKALHDRDNLGLHVVSDVDATGKRHPGGYPWLAIGDGHLRGAQGQSTGAMATACLRASVEELESARDMGARSSGRTTTREQKYAALKRAVGSNPGWAAWAYIPREDHTSTDSRLPGIGRSESPLEWRWGRLGTQTYAALDHVVKNGVASELLAVAKSIDDTAAGGPGGMVRISGIRTAVEEFAKHLRRDGARALERAVGTPARSRS